ncbi:MAG: outer membrane beta-barrel protein [Saprospiraceae bacterium]|jgi:hypothetical protein|nr:outer membrane beta-barrel protein [Saprospiraceae bacterium]
MKDNEFDNLFRHKLSNLQEPEADMAGWEAINGNLRTKSVLPDWVKSKWLIAASVLLLSNVFFIYQWQVSNSNLAALKNKAELHSTETNTTTQTINNQTKLTPSSNTTQPQNNELSDNKQQATKLATNTPLLNKQPLNDQKITPVTETFSYQRNNIQKSASLLKQHEASNTKLNSVNRNTESQDRNSTVVSVNQASLTSGEFTHNNSEKAITTTTTESRTTRLDQTNENESSLSENVINTDNSSILTNGSETTNINTPRTDNEQPKQDIADVKPAEKQVAEIQDFDTQAKELPIPQSKKNYVMPNIRLGLWGGGVHAYVPRANNNMELNYGFFTEVGIWKGLFLGAQIGRISHMIESDKPDCFKDFPQHDPGPDFKFKSLESKQIDIVQYGLTLKYEFKHINRWRPYLLAGIIAAQMDPLDVKFKFKGKKPNEEQIYEARVAEGSNKIQGINFAAGLSYRISNRWSAFADANYLKNIQTDTRSSFDNSGIRFGVYFQL